jgi:large subunit ribosomal protein L21|tara:strand:- start:39 stop:389 length:351 start_codon:yes stop_codon:yes gene_type:complete
MIAVIKTGGKQYKVKEGDTLKVEKLDVEKPAKGWSASGRDNSIIDFNEVLLVSDKFADDVKIGTPHLEGAKVTAKVLDQGRAKKIDVIKYKRKIRYRKKYGHRQPYTEVKIEKITV